MRYIIQIALAILALAALIRGEENDRKRYRSKRKRRN